MIDFQAGDRVALVPHASDEVVHHGGLRSVYDERFAQREDIHATILAPNDIDPANFVKVRFDDGTEDDSVATWLLRPLDVVERLGELDS